MLQIKYWFYYSFYERWSHCKSCFKGCIALKKLCWPVLVSPTFFSVRKIRCIISFFAVWHTYLSCGTLSACPAKIKFKIKKKKKHAKRSTYDIKTYLSVVSHQTAHKYLKLLREGRRDNTCKKKKGQLFSLFFHLTDLLVWCMQSFFLIRFIDYVSSQTI